MVAYRFFVLNSRHSWPPHSAVCSASPAQSVRPYRQTRLRRERSVVPQVNGHKVQALQSLQIAKIEKVA